MYCVGGRSRYNYLGGEYRGGKEYWRGYNNHSIEIGGMIESRLRKGCRSSTNEDSRKKSYVAVKGEALTSRTIELGS